MFHMKGTDNYSDRFDFFRWSAPVYETPKEVTAALNQIDFRNKKLEAIRCIGAAEVVGLHSPALYHAIVNAGIEPGAGWRETYLSRMPIARKVSLCEPIQMVFTDGSTFEFMPMGDGGARFSQNCIPRTITDGLNRSNIDLNAFLGNLAAGREICACEMYVDRKETVYYHDAGCMDNPYTKIRTQYRYEFSLGCPYRCDTIPYGEAQECIRQVRQIYITAGRDGDGGAFWIVPVHSDGRPYKKEHRISDYDNCGMSVDDYFVHEFLSTFLNKYFDPDIQEDDHDLDGFDEYGGNLYTRESMRKIVEEIREAVILLQTDFDHPGLAEIKKHFHPYTFSGKMGGALSEEEKNDLFRENIDLAIDFYTRFADRIASMLAEQPDCDVISFAGP